MVMDDLKEYPRNKPNSYYTAELKRTKAMLNRNQQWVDYCAKKIIIIEQILNKRGVEPNEFAKTIKV